MSGRACFLDLRALVDEGVEVDVHAWHFSPRRVAGVQQAATYADMKFAPVTRNGAWPRNEIDRFILARLEKANLEPSPEADCEYCDFHRVCPIQPQGRLVPIRPSTAVKNSARP